MLHTSLGSSSTQLQNNTPTLGARQKVALLPWGRKACYGY